VWTWLVIADSRCDGKVQERVCDVNGQEKEVDAHTCEDTVELELLVDVLRRC
jgi:hypothetical protein